MELNFENELEKLRYEIDRAKDLRDKWGAVIPVTDNQSQSTININAGGIGIWICATLCAMCLMLCLFVLWVVSDIKQNDRDQGNQLNAIYQQVPEIREIVQKDSGKK